MQWLELIVWQTSCYKELQVWPRLPGCALCNSAGLFSSELELFAEFDCCEKYVYSLGSYGQLASSSSCLAFFFDANMNISLSGRDTAYLDRNSAVSRRLKGWGKKLLREENGQDKDWWAVAEKLVIWGLKKACSLSILKHSDYKYIIEFAFEYWTVAVNLSLVNRESSCHWEVVADLLFHMAGCSLPCVMKTNLEISFQTSVFQQMWYLFMLVKNDDEECSLSS